MTNPPVNPGDRVDPPPHDELDALLWAWHDQNVRQAEAGRPRTVGKLFEEAAAAPEPVALIGPHGIEQRRHAAEVVVTFVRHRYTRFAAALAIVATLVTLLVPTGARQVWAGEALVARAGRLDALDAAGALIGPCPLDFTDVEATVTGPMSRVTVTQTYHNPYARAIEAVYTFPLSRRAAVDAFSMTIGERVVIGEVHERVEARRIFESARRRGRPAALLETGASRVYAQRVTNIPPGAEVEVRFTYVETLEFRDGAFHFSFPLEVAPRYMPPESQFAHGTPLPAGLAHRHGLNLLGPASVTVAAVEEGKPAALPAPAIETVLNAAHPIHAPGVESPVTQAFQVSYDDGATEDGAILADGTGRIADRWFWVDSGLLERVRAGVAGGPTVTTPAPAPVLPERRPGDDVAVTVTIDAAGAGLLGINSSSHDVLVREGDTSTVMLAYDETIPNRAFELSWQVRDDSPSLFVHAGEYGDYSGRFFALQVPAPPSHASDGAGNIDLAFAFSEGLDVVNAYAASVPAETGDPLLIVGQYREPGSGTLGIHGKTGDLVLGEEIALTLPEATEENRMIATLWAQAKLEEIEPGDTEQIVALSRSFGILGDHTSFVTVEKAQVIIDGKPLLVRVPVQTTETAVDDRTLGYVVSDQPVGDAFAGGQYREVVSDAPGYAFGKASVDVKERAAGLSRWKDMSEAETKMSGLAFENAEPEKGGEPPQYKASHEADADSRAAGGGGALADDERDQEIAAAAGLASSAQATADKLVDEGAALDTYAAEPTRGIKRDNASALGERRTAPAPGPAAAPAPGEDAFRFGPPMSRPEMIADVMTKLVESDAWERNGGTQLRAVVTNGRVEVVPLVMSLSTKAIVDRAVNFLKQHEDSFGDGREEESVFTGFHESPANAELIEKMRSTYLGSLFSNDVALERALKDIGEQAQIEIDPDWTALNKIGVEATDPVSLHPTSLGLAMKSVVDQIGSENTHPVLEARLGRLVVTSDEARRRHTSIVEYDVRDLIDAAKLTADKESLAELPGSSWTAERLGHTLSTFIDPVGWDSYGGETSVFIARDGRLFVRTMLANHRLIQRVLAQLRLALDLPVDETDRAAAEAVQQLVVSPEDEQVRALLAQTAPPHDLPGGSVEEVLVELSQASEWVISVDWPSLAGLGATRDDQVTLSGSAETVGDALDEVLGQLGTTGERPRYTVERGRVVIASDAALSRRTEILAYDVREVLRRPLPVRWSGNGASRPADASGVQELLDTILTGVALKSGRVNGVDTGEVTLFGGALVVANTLENHRAINEQLDELRTSFRAQNTLSLQGRVLPAQATDAGRVGEVLDRRLWDDMRRDDARPGLGTRRAEPVRVAILVSAVEPSVRAQIARVDGEIKAMVPSCRLIVADVPPDQLRVLATLPGILRIEPLDAEPAE